MGKKSTTMFIITAIFRFCKQVLVKLICAKAFINAISLQVLVKSKDDYGIYKCRAHNALGRKEHVIDLIEGIKPEVPQKFALRGLSSNTFDIDVGAKRDLKNFHKMDITGYRFEIIQKDIFIENGENWSRSWIKDFAVADGATYLLAPLSANTTYMVRVASRNVAGFSDWSETKEFATLLKQPYVSNEAPGMHFSLLLFKALALHSLLTI